MESYNIHKNTKMYDGYLVKDGQIVIPSGDDLNYLQLWQDVGGNSSYYRNSYNGNWGFQYYSAADYGLSIQLNTNAYDFFVKGTVGGYAYGSLTNYSSRLAEVSINFEGATQETSAKSAVSVSKEKTFNQFAPLTHLKARIYTYPSYYSYMSITTIIYFKSDCTIAYKKK